MSLSLVWSNLIAYCLQVGLLVGVAALAPALLRLQSSRARLAYWQLLLAACLLLPAIRPWQRNVVAETVTMTSRVIAVAESGAPAARTLSPVEIALGVLVLGVAARLVWLGSGFWKLRRYRRRSQAFSAALPWPSRAELRIAPEVSGPVTFGARRPVVLLPPQFPALGARAQEAILCHELLHVERGDWLFTVAEEFVRAVFWFHPAIWWLLGEIQLAREQAVDREVIQRTQAREEYVDALLAIAGAKPQLDLAPAPLFLRKRHLKHRVVSILKETRMSKARLISALAASLSLLVAACWLVTNTFPLAAAPQVIADSPGVSVDVGTATLMHRAPVAYPETARAKRIQGAVILELTFDSRGNVADARVSSGPEELRSAALQSALQWHFGHEAAGNRRQVTIAFQLPPENAPAVSSTAGVAPAPGVKEAAPVRPAAVRRPVKSIRVLGLSDQARDELLARLPLRIGASATDQEIESAVAAARGFDEHLKLYLVRSGSDEVAITLQAAPTAVPASANDSQRIKVGGNQQSTKLIRQARPVYPLEAKEARIQGAVKLMAVIGKDGTIQQLEVISGHPLLVESALEAVKQWAYEPTLLNGAPVEVQTQIDVNYTLSQ